MPLDNLTQITSSGISSSSTITVSAIAGQITGNVNSTGVSTFSSLPRLNVTGVSTFTTGPVLIGSGTSTGTASQTLQVTGGAYFSTIGAGVGIGITNPTGRFNVYGGTTWLDNASGDTQIRAQVLTAGFAPASNFTPGSDPTDNLRNTTFAVKGSTRPTVVTWRNIDNSSAFWDFIADGNSNKFYIQKGGNNTPVLTWDTNNNVLINTTTATGTASQPLQVNGGAYFSGTGNVGIGTTNPDQTFTIQSGGDAQISLKNTSGISKAYLGTSGAFGSASTDDLRIRSDASNIIFGFSGTEAARITSSGNLLFNSGYGSVATAYGCRAWVNFNGTTASPSTMRGSGNVSSVTKNAAGDYTVNFTNAMPDANYAVSWNSGMKSVVWGLPLFAGLSGYGNNDSHSTTQVRMVAVSPADVPTDNAMCNCAVFR